MSNKKISNKEGLPNPQQLFVMMQRYSNMRITPIDNKQKPMVLKTEASEFKKPIFFNTDCGKVKNKIKMALKQQAFYPTEYQNKMSRVVLDGNANMIEQTCEHHRKLLGDDPYNPNSPYEHNLYLIQGNEIPEDKLYQALLDIGEIE